MPELEQYIPKILNLFNQAYAAPEHISLFPEELVGQEENVKAVARLVFSNLKEQEQWQPFWFLVTPTYLRLFRFEEVFGNTAHQPWLYLLYLDFCRQFPEFAPVTAVASLDDVL